MSTNTTTAGWEGILAEGESILWQGRPDAQIVWREILSFQSFFGLFFAGFAVFWIAGAAATIGMARSSGGIDGVFAFFPLFGLPFLLVGLYLVAGRLLWDAYARKHTWYTLTDRGAYIARELMGRRSLKRYSFDEMGAIDLHDNTPGSVFFAEELRQHRHRSGGRNGGLGRSRTSTQRIPIGFQRIDDARHVYRLLSDTRDAAQATAAD